MSSLGKIFLYLLVTILAGALAAPQAWNAIHALSPELFQGFAGKVQSMPFHRYLSRSLQVSAVILLWPLLRSLRIRSLREFGLVPNSRPLRDLAVGMAAGALCMVLLLPAQVLSGAYMLFPGWEHQVISSLPRIIGTAILVAVMEEFLFRGVIMGFCRQFAVPSASVIASALAFALVHFVGLPPGEAGAADPSWWGGLAMLASAGSALPPAGILAGAFATLFAAGMILGWLTIRTGSLHAAIGLHGVWILGEQAFNKAAGFHVFPRDAMMPLYGPSQCSGVVPVGLVPLAALLLAGCLAFLLLRRRPLPQAA